jgi:D-glycero-D-manno-heptose 1,7-bisphosphate phosphatase
LIGFPHLGLHAIIIELDFQPGRRDRHPKPAAEMAARCRCIGLSGNFNPPNRWHPRAAAPGIRMSRQWAPPVFLDRDGTLIEEKDYLSDPRLVYLEEGVVEGLTLLMEHRHPLIVLSNQSGIGRGLFFESDARRVNARLSDMLRAYGIAIMGWYLCPHAPEVQCECRKPLPGMAIAASRDWHLTLPGSYVIGDKQTDLELADAIGATGILVTTGHGRKFADRACREARPVFADLLGAAEYIAKCDDVAAATP